MTAASDPTLEGGADDCFYRHADSGVVCVCDARLDAAPALTAHSTTPAAQLCHAYLAFGLDFPLPLRGDYAVAIWDPHHQRLVLLVDRAAQRGLFFRRQGRQVRFATDLPVLLSQDANHPALAAEDWAAWLLAPSRGATIAGGAAEHVPAGHLAVIADGALRLRRYWTPQDAPDIRFRHATAYLDAAEAVLTEAISCRLPQHRSLGCQLSGGLDSALVTGFSARLLAKRGRSLTAFTFAHSDPACAEQWQGQYWDEHHSAARFAQGFANIEAVTVSSDAPDLFDGLESFLAGAGVPSLSCLSVWAARHAVGDLARQHGIGVMLTGIAGNETVTQGELGLLSELARHGRVAAVLREWMALWQAGKPVAKTLGCTLVPLLPPALQRLACRWAGSRKARHWEELAPLTPGLRDKLAAAGRLDAWEAIPRWPTPRQIASHLANANAWSVSAWYRHSYGIDLRSPFLDSRVIEFCAGLPPEQYLGGGETRHLGRRLLRRLGAPPALVNETRRGIQYANWHRQMLRARPQLYRELEANAANATVRTVIDLAELRRLIESLPQANPASQDDLQRYGNRLSIGLSVGRFIRHMERSNSGPPLDDFSQETMPHAAP